MISKDTHINLTKRFVAFIKEHTLLHSEDHVLLAVSGGIDSVVMTHLFYEAGLRFSLAHGNFGLRGQESDEDERFVQHLAQQYQVACFTTRFDTKDYATTHKISTQMAARELRYEWFKKLCYQHAFSKIATAHHANDCLETVLFNLTKGTGITGLHGILPKSELIIRPLLFAPKALVRKYAQEKNLLWREDSSNQQDHYARNLIRNQVVPTLQQLNPNLITTHYMTLERLVQVEAFFQEQLDIFRNTLSYQEDGLFHFAVDTIRDKIWAPVVLWELLKPFGFNFIQIKSLLHASEPSGKCIYAKNYQLATDRTTWILTGREQPAFSTQTIPDPHTPNIPFLAHRLQLQSVPKSLYPIIPHPQVAALDVERLQFPLLVRPWERGDYFYPLGMKQKKKISDFLIDQKVPRALKDQVHVLVSQGQIAWVIGYRIDERFKITSTTKQVYELKVDASLM
eukprot:gene146-198_t